MMKTSGDQPHESGTGVSVPLHIYCTSTRLPALEYLIALRDVFDWPNVVSTAVLSCVWVTKNGVRIGNWIYCILAGRNYN
jgi:hypothetical protein